MMKRFLAILLAAAMLAAVLVGCGPTETPPDSGQQGSNQGSGQGTAPPAQGSGGGQSTPGGTAEPKRTDVRIGLGGEVLCLDPFYSNITQDTMPGKLIHDSLIENDEKGELKPCLAKSWEVSADGMEYLFHLEEGVSFHDGTAMTAEDVVWSFARGIESPYMASSMGKYLSHAEVVDGQTVKLHMKMPYAAILSMLVMNMVVESKNHFEVTCGGNEDQYRMNPVGTGPYKFVKYESGYGLTLEGFDDYWRGAPAIKDMFMRIISDTNAVHAALETGDIDLSGVSASVSNSYLPTLEANEDLNVSYLEGTMVWYFPINTDPVMNPGYENVKVRQAMAYALDKEYLMEVQSEGYGEIAHCMNSPTTYGYYDQPRFEYDVAKAKALLEEAGFPNGEGLGALKATIRQDRQKGTEVYQQNLQEIGIDVVINVMETTTYLNACKEGDFGISLIASTMPPDAAMFDKFWVTENIGADNYARLANAELDALLMDAATSADHAGRPALYAKAYELANSLCAYIPVFYAANICVYSKGLYIGVRYPDAPYLRFEEMRWE